MDHKDNHDQKIGCLHMAGLILLALLLIISVAVWISKYYLFPRFLSPVTLNSQEEQILQQKLNAMSMDNTVVTTNNTAVLQRVSTTSLAPSTQEISLSEKELNALLARYTTRGKQIAIDLNDTLTQATLLIPIQENIPFIGGDSIKSRADVIWPSQTDPPVVQFTQVRPQGFDLPAQWLTPFNQLDLRQEVLDANERWQEVVKRIQSLKVQGDHLLIRFKD